MLENIIVNHISLNLCISMRRWYLMPENKMPRTRACDLSTIFNEAKYAIKSISRKYFNYLVKYLHKMQWNASAQVYLKFLMVIGKRSTAWLWTGVMLNLTGKQSWWNLTTELRPTDGTQIRCLLPPAARNWFLLQVSDGGWLARGDDIVFCNGMFHQQMATTFITFIFGGRISTKVSKISCYL